jgi:hypothetical protein
VGDHGELEHRPWFWVVSSSSFTRTKLLHPAEPHERPVSPPGEEARQCNESDRQA